MKLTHPYQTTNTEHGELVYQTVSSEPIVLACEEFPIAFSILIARAEGDAVTETAFAYDVSRDIEICEQITEQLWQRETRPDELLDTIAELL